MFERWTSLQFIKNFFKDFWPKFESSALAWNFNPSKAWNFQPFWSLKFQALEGLKFQALEGLKGVFSKSSGDYIVVPNFCLLS